MTEKEKKEYSEITDYYDEEFLESIDTTELSILNTLLDGEHNLDLKTEIQKPRKMTALSLRATQLDDIGFSDAGGIVGKFQRHFRRDMISYNRKSRDETITGVVGLKKDDDYKDTLDKLLERA